MGIEDRLRRLEDANPNLCREHASPCRQPVAITEVEYIKGTEVLIEGAPAEPLCDECPELAMREPPIREVKVVRNAYSDDAPHDDGQDVVVWP